MTHTPPAKWIAVWIICAVVFFLFAICAKALTPAEREVVTGMRDTITELRGKLDGAEKANDAALQSLTLANTQLVNLHDALQLADEQVRAVAGERDQALAAADRLTVAMHALNQKYQFAQFLIAVTTAMLAGVGTMYLTRGLQFPYNCAVPAGVAGAAYMLVTILL
jgi:hypothetical protein